MTICLAFEGQKISDNDDDDGDECGCEYLTSLTDLNYSLYFGVTRGTRKTNPNILS